ncbi:MAG: bifunctional DNA-formamidopyrimidine glycosylase/DNA-(apurinic or apyrimidinic site) lyase [Hyphomicrobiales bacterium]|nr:bifunctional DNA-formamidopyrimidine glycosylase/DNA-(apurinic or apyrimidinic site) lyase [Hyphomicrobiales bacterium]
MPELPEVETVCRGLEPVLVGAAFLEVEQRRDALRFPLPDRFADRLRGQTVRTMNRRAKYILAELDGGDVLAVHLGMSGRFTIERPAGKAKKPGNFFHEAGTDPAHDHLVFRMSNGATVRYNDVRRFGYMTLVAADALDAHPLFRDLGVEPLGNALTAEHLAAACAGKQASLKAALMDQRIVAGLGNIYVCEALYRAGLAPRHKAAVLATKAGGPSVRAERLVAAIQAVLREAIDAGGSTLRDYHQADGSLGYFQHSFAVYGREGQSCARPGCGGTVRRIVQTGRSTFYCPRCQR